ncbi:hypothetical protein [Microbacterium sp.]|uniref:hypothetical protein n=1 Tax=Microbacterium sp. TaxID=51671 RepID=UPI0039E6BE35
MRKTSAALATLTFAALALTGCSSSTAAFDGETCDRAAASSRALADSVTATGEIGAAPEVDIVTPLAGKKSSFADAVVGEGTVIVSESQPFLANVTTYDGTTGDEMQTTGYDRDATPPHDIAYWNQLSPALGAALQCATGGSRVVAAVTAEDLGGTADQGSVVFVFDIPEVFLSKAEGDPQFNDARGLPTVVRAPDGTPGVIIPDTPAPTETVAQTLIRGDGPIVTEDDFVVVNHTVLNWDDKQVATTTWGSASLVTAPLPEMVGATVGSQLMIIIPGEDDASAQVVVVDILGISPTAPQQQQ